MNNNKKTTFQILHDEIKTLWIINQDRKCPKSLFWNWTGLKTWEDLLSLVVVCAYGDPMSEAAALIAGVTTVHQPAPVVTKQVHYGQTSYVPGYATKIHKPATPNLPIAVPTVPTV